MNKVYLDTSAYLAVLLGEKDGPDISSKMQNKILCSSILLCIETERNLVHLVRTGQLSNDDFDLAYQKAIEDQEHFIFLNLTADLCFTRNFPMVKTPRSADLVHLRSALWFFENDSLEAFISLDIKQNQAAKEMGLPVEH